MSDIPNRTDELAEFHGEIFAPVAAVPPPPNGHHSAPRMDVSEIIQRASAARNGDKFQRLMDGNVSDYGGDDSAADAALCALLAFWTQDPGMIDAVVRQSGLYREKWERADYRQRTIAGALGLATETYGSNVSRSVTGIRVEPSDPAIFREPEDRGRATLSELGTLEYVEDLIRPGRIVVWAAEEGSGKSYAATGETGIRLAVAGGSFAETWPVLQQGAVLVLSEMHTDDDFQREETVLASLGFRRVDLVGRYFRLPIVTAAGGKPPLTDVLWRAWITAWMRSKGVVSLIVDTATAATNVDPWGEHIQSVYTGIRVMQAEYPELAVILVVHLKKPQGRGERRISDVLGEWGRWCDVIVLQENDGASLTRTRLTVRKRVRQERRIVATKQGGLLVDAQGIEGKGPKVPMEEVVKTVQEQPGLTLQELATALGVGRSTVTGYVAEAEKQGLFTTAPGPRGAKLVLPGLEGSLNTDPPPFRSFQ